MVHAMHVAEVYTGGTDPNRDWEIEGVGDFGADGLPDILWRHRGGALAIWGKGRYEAGQAYPTYQNQPGAHPGTDWQVAGVGDFNADGGADILWRHDTGVVTIWLMDGGTFLGESGYFSRPTSHQFRDVMPQAPARLALN
jgi:hypothetical protein